MVKARKLPSGNWRALAYSGIVNGKRSYKSFTAPTRREAEFLAAEYALKKKETLYNDITLGEAYTKYIESKSNVLAPDTVAEYSRAAKRDLQNLMPVKLKKLTQEMIQQEVNREALTHSPKTVKNMHGLLSSVLSVFEPDFKLRTRLPQKERKELYIPTDADISVLVENMNGLSIEIPILLAAFGALRRSEIAALDVENDIKGNVICISKAMVRGKNGDWVIKKPKSYAGYRTVEIPDFVAEKLKGWQNTMKPNTITNKFIILLKKCNLPHFRFHDLRHYHASILHALNIPDKYIMQRGGWSNRETLNKVYQHAMSDKARIFTDEALKHFNNTFFK